jgi:hypothetical protein
MSVYRSSDSETVNGIWYVVFLSLTVLMYMMVMGGESGVMRIVRLIMWVWLGFWMGLMSTTRRNDEYRVGEDRNTGDLEDDAGDFFEDHCEEEKEAEDREHWMMLGAWSSCGKIVSELCVCNTLPRSNVCRQPPERRVRC